MTYIFIGTDHNGHKKKLSANGGVAMAGEDVFYGTEFQAATEANRRIKLFNECSALTLRSVKIKELT